jgi:hypothetical protein
MTAIGKWNRRPAAQDPPVVASICLLYTGQSQVAPRISSVLVRNRASLPYVAFLKAASRSHLKRGRLVISYLLGYPS